MTLVDEHIMIGEKVQYGDMMWRIAYMTVKSIKTLDFLNIITTNAELCFTV